MGGKQKRRGLMVDGSELRNKALWFEGLGLPLPKVWGVQSQSSQIRSNFVVRGAPHHSRLLHHPIYIMAFKDPRVQYLGLKWVCVRICGSKVWSSYGLGFTSS